MIVAVTGGTGFLGYHLVPALIDAGYHVRLLTRPSSTHPLVTSYPKEVQRANVDFSDANAIEKALQGAGAIIHAAGLVSYDRDAQPKMHETHVELTRRMLEAARRAGLKRFVHVSSIVTLGHSSVPRDESAEYNAAPLHLAYWDTKFEAERLALAANGPDIEVVVVNPGSLIGAGEKGGQLLPFVRKLARSERPFLPSGGSDFLDVRDGARGTVLALERGKPGSRYVLGAVNLSYAEFHKLMRTMLGKKSRPRMVPRWALGIVERLLRFFETLTHMDLSVNSARLRRVNGVYMFHDISKAKRELGYSPGRLEPAIREMIK